MKNQFRKKNRSSFLLPFAALALSLGGSLQASVMLCDYQFASTNSSGTSSVLPSNATLSPVSSGNAAQVSINSTGQNASYTPAGPSSDSSAAQAISNNFYIEFTLTPTANFAVSLDSITFDIGGSSTAPNTFNANFFVRSNLVGTGFDTNVGSLQTYSVPAGSVSGNTPQGTTITLNLLPAFQNVTSPVTFRIYAYGDNYAPSFTGSDRPRLDNLILNGDVTAVPEPSSAALTTLALALTGLVIFGRRVRSIS